LALWEQSVSREEIYRRAWNLLQGRIENKTTWGKNELRDQMFQVLQQAVDEVKGGENG
jgi:hypothetical protein